MTIFTFENEVELANIIYVISLNYKVAPPRQDSLAILDLQLAIINLEVLFTE